MNSKKLTIFKNYPNLKLKVKNYPIFPLKIKAENLRLGRRIQIVKRFDIRVDYEYIVHLTLK